MLAISNPTSFWVLLILISVILGIFVLIAVAFVRRWQQVRYSRYLHTLQRRYRPVLASVLAGVRSPRGVVALRELPLADMEHLLEPLFTRRKLTERQLVFLQELCVELGLVALWEKRTANGNLAASGSTAPVNSTEPRALRHLLRARSIRNLGKLRHQPSWPILMQAVDDPHPDIQRVALRSLAEAGAPESFPALRDRLHAVVQGKSYSPPLPELQGAMVSFDIGSAPSLLPSLLDPNWQLRLHAMEILRRIVCRAAARHTNLALTPELLTPQMVELLLTALAHDTSADIRARAADVIVFLTDSRTPSVLHELLADSQWFVRLHATRSLARLRQADLVYLEARNRLRDPHCRVREAAIQTLISFGPEGQRHLYVHFLTSPDRITRDQIIEVIERAGLMSSLVERFGEGRKCVDAFMVEEITSDTVPAGLSGILLTMSPEVCHKFMQRFLPYARAKRPLLNGLPPVMINAIRLQQTLRLRHRATRGGIPYA